MKALLLGTAITLKSLATTALSHRELDLIDRRRQVKIDDAFRFEFPEDFNIFEHREDGFYVKELDCSLGVDDESFINMMFSIMNHDKWGGDARKMLMTSDWLEIIHQGVQDGKHIECFEQRVRVLELKSKLLRIV